MMIPTALETLLTPHMHSSGLDVFDPASGERVCTLKEHSAQDIERMISRAEAAQHRWAKQSAKHRSELLRAWFELLQHHHEALATLLTLEQGKPLQEACGELVYGASFVEWFSEEAKRAYGQTIPATANSRRINTIKQPIGVSAAITPWNFPVAMITRKAAPALAAGCSMLLKPSELTPLSALAIAELAYQAGIEADLMPVIVSAQAAQVGEQLCLDQRVRKLSFTGSTRVGKLLAQQSAHNLKKLSLELGGNAPFIVFADADIDAAVSGFIASKFRNAGQTCICANRLYLHSDIYHAFVTRLLGQVEQMRVGPGTDTSAQIGPLISLQAKARVEALVTSAVEQGATRLTPATPYLGQFMAPVVLTDVTQEMEIVSQEIFGPVVPILRFDSDDEVVAMANDTQYGLASYFFTESLSRAISISEQLAFGMVGINEGIISTEVAPFGGVKESGVGREGGREGLDEYLETKYVCIGGLA